MTISDIPHDYTIDEHTFDGYMFGEGFMNIYDMSDKNVITNPSQTINEHITIIYGNTTNNKITINTYTSCTTITETKMLPIQNVALIAFANECVRDIVVLM